MAACSGTSGATIRLKPATRPKGVQGTTMCGRFTQNYTWEEVYAFLAVFGARGICGRTTKHRADGHVGR